MFKQQTNMEPPLHTAAKQLLCHTFAESPPKPRLIPRGNSSCGFPVAPDMKSRALLKFGFLVPSPFARGGIYRGSCGVSPRQGFAEAPFTLMPGGISSFGSGVCCGVIPPELTADV